MQFFSHVGYNIKTIRQRKQWLSKTDFDCKRIYNNRFHLHYIHTAQGTVQLSEGSSGSVSIYDNGWKKLCDYNTGQSDADLICRLSGFRNAISYDYSYVSANSDTIDYISYIDCIGNEKNLLDCVHYSSYYCFDETIITCETGK